MRLEIILEGKGTLKVPLYYNAALQGFVYSILGKIATRIHDEGFGEYRKFKMFVFSELFGDTRKITDRYIYFKSPVKFYLASPYTFVIQSIFDRIFNDSSGLSFHGFRITGINIQEDSMDGDEIVARTLSPITAYRTFKDIDGKNKTIYFSPAEREFVELLEKNLQRKHKVFYGSEFDGDIVIEPLEVDCLRDYRKVLYKGTVVKGWHGKFRLKAPPEILKLALYAGLGSKNSQGFGMIKREDE